MRELVYRVGRDGYYTTCRTLESAQVQASLDKKYTITPVLVEIAESEPKLSPKRAEMLNKYGMAI